MAGSSSRVATPFVRTHISFLSAYHTNTNGKRRLTPSTVAFTSQIKTSALVNFESPTKVDKFLQCLVTHVTSCHTRDFLTPALEYLIFPHEVWVAPSKILSKKKKARVRVFVLSDLLLLGFAKYLHTRALKPEQ